MSHVAGISFGIAIALSWLAIWALALHVLGITVFSRKPENRAASRERIKRMGKLRYIFVFGVLRLGVGLGLALTIPELLRFGSHGLISLIVEFVLISIGAGWFDGARTWSENYRDPVPFPPNFSSMK